MRIIIATLTSNIHTYQFSSPLLSLLGQGKILQNDNLYPGFSFPEIEIECVMVKNSCLSTNKELGFTS